MRIQLLLLSLTIAFASNLASPSACGPHVETQYLIELPEAFVKTLNTDEAGKANLWHPKLTLTKVHSIQNASNSVLQEKKANNPSRAFSSFLQIQQTNTPTDSLTLIPGGQDGTSVVKSSKMNCGCRFVKDPNGMSFIQTDQSVSVGTTDSQLQAATSFIEKEDKSVPVAEVAEVTEETKENVSLIEETPKLVENKVEEKAKEISVEDDPEIKALLEKKERMKKMEEDLEKELAKEKEKKEQEKLMLEMLQKEEQSKKEQEDREMAALLEKKKLLQEIQEEEEAFREKLKKKEEEDQLMKMLEKEKKELEQLKELEKMRDLESQLNKKSEIEMLLEETASPKYNNRDSMDDMLYRDQILAEFRGKEPRHQDDLKDKFQLLFDEMPETGSGLGNDDDDLAGFFEFTQRYQRYKSLLTEQQSKQKNKRLDLDSYGNDLNDRDLEDYQLLKKIKAVKDKSMREELIEALLSE